MLTYSECKTVNVRNLLFFVDFNAGVCYTVLHLLRNERSYF